MKFMTIVGCTFAWPWPPVLLKPPPSDQRLDLKISATVLTTLSATEARFDEVIPVGICANESICDNAPPVAPMVCASSNGENRAADAVTAALALFESVNVVPEIALIFVPLGTFGCETNMPTKRPAAEPTDDDALPRVAGLVVQTRSTLDALRRAP